MHCNHETLTLSRTDTLTVAVRVRLVRVATNAGMPHSSAASAAAMADAAALASPATLTADGVIGSSAGPETSASSANLTSTDIVLPLAPAWRTPGMRDPPSCLSAVATWMFAAPELLASGFRFGWAGAAAADAAGTPAVALLERLWLRELPCEPTLDRDTLLPQDEEDEVMEEEEEAAAELGAAEARRAAMRGSARAEAALSREEAALPLRASRLACFRASSSASSSSSSSSSLVPPTVKDSPVSASHASVMARSLAVTLGRSRLMRRSSFSSRRRLRVGKAIHTHQARSDDRERVVAADKTAWARSIPLGMSERHDSRCPAAPRGEACGVGNDALVLVLVSQDGLALGEHAEDGAHLLRSSL